VTAQCRLTHGDICSGFLARATLSSDSTDGKDMDRRIHFRPTVEADETLYAYTPADNGADPLWCYGSTCIVADDAQVYVAGLETVPDTLPPNNVRWVLYRRSRGWQSVFTDVGHLTREPCPLGYSRGRLWLSANPAVQPIPGKWALPAQPQILEFSASSPTAGYSVSLPDWGGELPFTEHSYRGMAVDGPQGEILLLNINGHTAQQWAYRNGEGLWAAHGQLAFPWSMEDSVALRLCYPNVALSGGQAVVVGVSDIVEPHADWKAAKFEITRRGTTSFAGSTTPGRRPSARSPSVDGWRSPTRRGSRATYGTRTP